ncbi:hypothetical protein J2S08_000306 [Bacillus chungangensis]|uniref:MarR family transcriptional regulator n=1 Tax=Bacillus chungangensis TaxID=587633 RepID=A0ABT9WMF2_9BACI|nr:hypothetical protein [Bacillus chungangensis]
MRIYNVDIFLTITPLLTMLSKFLKNSKETFFAELQ